MTALGPFNCPCCRFPTLSERGGYDICIICWWEDDGQSDRNADKVRGGPNGSYSLTQARGNFADHGHMYAANQGIEEVERPSKARSDLVSYLRTIDFDPNRADAVRFAELLRAVDRQVQSREGDHDEESQEQPED